MPLQGSQIPVLVMQAIAPKACKHLSMPGGGLFPVRRLYSIARLSQDNGFPFSAWLRGLAWR